MLRKVVLTAAFVASAPLPVNSAAAEDAAFTHISCKGEANEIRVTVANVKKSVGLMTVELYRNDPAGFLKKAGREYRIRFAARAPVTQFCITAPASGEFAVAVYHDRNANQKFDKNPFGFPAEPYGVSRNPVIHLAPPPIAETLIEVTEAGAATEIRLKD